MALLLHKKLNNPDAFIDWLHLDGNKPNCSLILKNEIKEFDKTIEEALLEVETRPRVMKFDDAAIVILRGLNFNDAADIEDMVSIRLWVQSDKIITVQRRQLQSIRDIEKSIDSGQGPKTTAGFLCNLLEGLNDRLTTQYLEIESKYENMEEMLLNINSLSTVSNNQNYINEINDYRRMVVLINRFLVPQSIAIAKIRRIAFTWIEDRHARYLEDAHNDTERIIEELQLLVSRFQLLREELNSIENQRMNRHSHTLTIIASIFLPLTFLTGVMGMNVSGIPMASESSAFLFLTLLFFVVILIQVLIFKKFKWF